MYIGIDLGTSSIKALLVDEKGIIIKEATESYPLYIDERNWSEQNPKDWYEGFIGVLKAVTKDHLNKIKGISFSGQMHGLVLLDENDLVIRPALLWNDQRTALEVDYLNDIIGKENLLDHTGNIAVTGFTAPKLLWIKKHEQDNYQKIAKVMLPKDYLIYMLTGNFITDYSDASGTLYFDVKNKKYSQYMLDILEISEDNLPKPQSSYKSCGLVKESIMKDLNLTGSISVFPGGGDQAIGAIGTGTVNDGDINISLGTSGVIFAATNQYQVDRKSYMHSFSHATDGYHLMGVTLAAAGSFQWWRNSFYPTVSYNEIFEEIVTTKIDDELYYLPYISGERSPINDPNARGSFVGINNTHQKKHFSRALIEGINYSLYQCYRLMLDLGVEPKKVRITGGGARNDNWNQMISDLFGIEVETIKATEGPAYGAAIVALVGSGVFSSLEKACETIIETKTKYYPNKENHLLYQNKYLKYLELYPSLKSFFSIK